MALKKAAKYLAKFDFLPFISEKRKRRTKIWFGWSSIASLAQGVREARRRKGKRFEKTLKVDDSIRDVDPQTNK